MQHIFISIHKYIYTVIQYHTQKHIHTQSVSKSVRSDQPHIALIYIVKISINSYNIGKYDIPI